MASIYKIIRKEKKIKAPVVSEELNQNSEDLSQGLPDGVVADSDVPTVNDIPDLYESENVEDDMDSVDFDAFFEASQEKATVDEDAEADVKSKKAVDTNDTNEEEIKISRTRNQATDAYVGSDKKAKHSQEVIGDKLDAIYNIGFKKTSSSANDETEEMLLSVFGTDEKPKKKKLFGGKKDKKNKNNKKTEKNEESLVVMDEQPGNAGLDIFEADNEVDLSENVVVSDDVMSFDEIEEFEETFDDGLLNETETVSEIENAVEDIEEGSENTDLSDSSDKITFDKADESNEYYDDDDDDDESIVLKKKEKPVIEEYTSTEQNEEILRMIKDKGVKYLLASIWIFIVTLALFWLETATFTDLHHPSFLMPGKNGIVFLLVDLQLLLVAAIFILDDIIDGVKRLFKGEANRNSVTFTVIAVSVIYVLSVILFNTTSTEYHLFSSVASAFAFLTAICSFLETKRAVSLFKIVSSKKQKFVAKRLYKESAEAEAFKEYLSDDPDIFTITKTDFVDNFVKRSTARASSNVIYKVSIPFVFIVGLVFAIFNYSTANSISEAVTAFTLIVIFGLPASSLFVLFMPLMNASMKAKKLESAILSETSVEEYAQATVISFADTEILPSKGVKMTSVRTYGDHRIDKTILYAAQIFKKIGGPLSNVFERSISGVYSDINTDFPILENAGDGICARIDFHEIFVGNKDYMLAYDFGYIKDEIDEAFEKSLGKIMFMAIDDEIAAKFYIKYSVSPSFEKSLKTLYKSGICVAVKTCDPNIDNALMMKLLKNKDYPVSVLKVDLDEMNVQSDMQREDSGIVCTSSILNMIRTFILCDGAKQRMATNIFIKFISLLFGIFSVVILYFMGQIGNITPALALAYHGLWLLPVIIPNLID